MLRRVGFDTDLAPVLDVAAPGSAMGAEGRSFGADPAVVARCAEAFADGLERHGVAPTAKHFPGLGAATGDTDVGGAADRQRRERTCGASTRRRTGRSRPAAAPGAW